MNSGSVQSFLAAFIAAAVLYPGAAAQTPPASPAAPQVLSLEDCLRIAMEKNHQRPASRFAVAVAEAQHRQALAGYWPQITAKGGVPRLDEGPNFIFPASTMYIPPQTISVPGGSQGGAFYSYALLVGPSSGATTVSSLRGKNVLVSS